MNTRQLLAVATAAIALVGSGAVIAQEAQQLEVPPSTLTRAEVKADLAHDPVGETVSEASYTVQAAAGTQNRAEVAAEAHDTEPLNVQRYVGE